MKIYTDGATSFNGQENAVGGWAYVVIDDQDNIIKKGMGHIPEGATNNICEMMAILEGCYAVEHIKGYHIIYSDSSYCINCYQQKWYKKWQENNWITSSKTPVKNKGLWKRLIPFFENEFFHFVKVKGHSDNKWNNYVDEMAVIAKEAPW